MATTKTAPRKGTNEGPADPTVKVADAGPCRKKLTVTVPAAAVARELSDALGAYATQAQLPGFRKGKAPTKLIERQFGKAARDEARNRLVSAAYSKAIEEHKLRVVGEPEGGEELLKSDLPADKALEFTLEVEVAPEFTLPTLEGIPVKKPRFEVTDAMIDDEVKRLALAEGELDSREKAEPGDYCTGKGVIKDKDGKIALEIDGAVIQIPTEDKKGKGAILGVLVDDFAKQAGLPKPGDTLKIKARGPAQHETVTIRNEPITIEFEVQRVDRIVPMGVAQLCERIGIPDETSLRQALRNRLQQRLMVRQQTVMRRQVAEHLLSKVEMELPERLSERQAVRTLERKRLDLMYRGFNPVQIEEQTAVMRAASAEVARRELKLFFILSKAAEDMQIGVTDAEINSRIAQMAAENGERPDRLRGELIRRGQVQMLAQQIREHKAMDALLSRATIAEVEPDKIKDEDAAA